ncbi:MAG TPA: signal peptidase I [Pyrinomonadaceae bacterium]
MKKRVAVCFILIFSLVCLGCSIKPVRLEGTAMLPSFHDGDRVFIDKQPGELKRGDVIMFLYPKDTSKRYFKRIIGLPGEKVEIREGKVFIDGQILDEPYLNREYNQTGDAFPPKTVPENHYYVLGDNRANSSDSRYWGTVSRDLITGKYVSTYFKANSK